MVSQFSFETIANGLLCCVAVQSENEFYVSQEMNPTATEAMILLEHALRKNGINKVPITCNDVYPSGNFASGEGQVDVYVNSHISCDLLSD